MTYEKVKPPIMAEIVRISERAAMKGRRKKGTKPHKPYSIHISEEFERLDRVCSCTVQ